MAHFIIRYLFIDGHVFCPVTTSIDHGPFIPRIFSNDPKAQSVLGTLRAWFRLDDQGLSDESDVTAMFEL